VHARCSLGRRCAGAPGIDRPSTPRPSALPKKPVVEERRSLRLGQGAGGAIIAPAAPDGTAKPSTRVTSVMRPFNKGRTILRVSQVLILQRLRPSHPSVHPVIKHLDWCERQGKRRPAKPCKGSHAGAPSERSSRTHPKNRHMSFHINYLTPASVEIRIPPCQPPVPDA
jgi:hypothetical protein